MTPTAMGSGSWKDHIVLFCHLHLKLSFLIYTSIEDASRHLIKKKKGREEERKFFILSGFLKKTINWKFFADCLQLFLLPCLTQMGS